MGNKDGLIYIFRKECSVINFVSGGLQCPQVDSQDSQWISWFILQEIESEQSMNEPNLLDVTGKLRLSIQPSSIN